MKEVEGVWIWLRRHYNKATFKIDIVGPTTTTVTGDTIQGEFTKQITRIGVHHFRLRLSNVNGKHDGQFAAGDEIKFYADYNDASTLQFWGRIDTIKDVTSEGVKSLELTGRHRSYRAQEKYINRGFSTTADNIRKSIIDNEMSGKGFTYANVEASATSVTRNFSGKTVFEALGDVDYDDEADSYFDDNLDLHSFKKNSKSTDDEAAVEGDNLIQDSVEGFGTDTFKSRNSITVYGRDNQGMMIIGTSGTGERELLINNSNARTNAEVDLIAGSYKNTIEELPPEGVCTTIGLRDINPGYLMVVSMPKIADVHAYYRIIQTTQIVGRRGWYTRIVAENEERTQSIILRDRMRKERELVEILNPNNMKYSYNFDFDSTPDAVELTGTVSDGKLKISAGTSASFTSTPKNLPEDVAYAEVRGIGNDLAGIVFEVSATGGAPWTVATPNTQVQLTQTGRKLALRVTLTSSTTYPSPEIDSLGGFAKP